MYCRLSPTITPRESSNSNLRVEWVLQPRGGRAVSGGRRPGPWLSGPTGSDGGAVRGQSVPAGRQPDVSGKALTPNGRQGFVRARPGWDDTGAGATDTTGRDPGAIYLMNLIKENLGAGEVFYSIRI